MKPKICIVSPFIPPDFAGAGRRAFNQAKYLAKNGYDMTVLTTTMYDSDVYNLDIITINTPKSYKKKGFISKVMRLIYKPYLLLKLYKTIKSNNIDIIHCIPSQPWFSLLSILAAKINGCKIITETTLYGSDDPITIKNSKLGGIKYKLINFSNEIINISPLLYETSKKTTIEKRKLSIIGNSVDTLKFKKVSSREKQRIRKEVGLPSDSIVLLCISIIRPRKGIEQLIHMFYSLTNETENICLVLAGPLSKDEENISYSNKLKQVVKEYELDSKVFFTGEINNPDEYLKASDIFLFASKREGFGTAIIEAMSSSLPVVTFNIPKITEYIIENKYDGIIVEDKQEMASYVKKLIDNSSLYGSISENARCSALARFSEEVIMRKYIETYHRIYNQC